MLICGIKLTHDGAVVLMKDDQILCSVEMEKLDNNRRYRRILDLSLVTRVIRNFGYEPSDIDRYVLDGWLGGREIPVEPEGRKIKLGLAPYKEPGDGPAFFEAYQGKGLVLDGKAYDYLSFAHVTNHLSSTYATSPFAKAKKKALVLCWDGGIRPRLYAFDPAIKGARYLGDLHRFNGNCYGLFAQHFQPFLSGDERVRDRFDVPGKVMAYLALGEPKEAYIQLLNSIYASWNETDLHGVNRLAEEFRERAPSHAKTADILASFHVFIERLLLEGLNRIDYGDFEGVRDLCYSGGCALNIKWNSTLRHCGRFDDVWIPPFPNDCGNAFGAVASYRLYKGLNPSVQWDAYMGPELLPSEAPSGWSGRPCDLPDLARFLWESKEPVVFLNGRAEVGPRALGNRSILACASDLSMKDVLNKAKVREDYRPVAPICLETYAGDVFEPGIPDPYMLFEHQVRSEWVDRVPAIVHLDGSARLQTINQNQNPRVAALLEHYRRLSGIPLLCNTSANDKGKGFFPSARDAMEWDGLEHVWADGILYSHGS